MAITYVGGDYRRSFGGDADPLTMVLPTHAADDFAILVAKSDASGHILALTVATGWTEIPASPWDDTSGLSRTTAAWYKKFTSSSETAPVITTDTSDQHAALVEIFRGVDTGTPFDATEVHADAADVALPDQPDITTVTANACIFIYHNFNDDDHTVMGAPSGYTLGESQVSGGNLGEGSAAAHLLDAGAAGLKEPGVWTHTASPTNESDYTCLTFALRLAGGGGDTPISAAGIVVNP